MIDVRHPEPGIDFIKDCIWMSPQAMKGGWTKILNKNNSYVVYEGSDIKEADKGAGAHLL